MQHNTLNWALHCSVIVCHHKNIIWYVLFFTPDFLKVFFCTKIHTRIEEFQLIIFTAQRKKLRTPQAASLLLPSSYLISRKLNLSRAWYSSASACFYNCVTDSVVYPSPPLCCTYQMGLLSWLARSIYCTALHHTKLTILVALILYIQLIQNVSY